MNKVTRFALALREKSDAASVLRVAFAYVFEHGVTMVSYHHLPPLGAFDHELVVPVVEHGFPSDWVRRYRAEALHLIDPIPRHALRAVHAFLWSDIYARADLTEKERGYLLLLNGAELGDGLAVPVFGPFGRNGYVGIGFGQGLPSPRPKVMLSLQIGAQLAHQRYCELLFAGQAGEVSLSQRETEILSWMARGKSNAVIAEILSLSSNTVDTYTRRIFSKLGVNDRVTAALRGLALGLIR